MAEAGFTLVELIVALALVALAMSLALPGLRPSFGQIRLEPLAAVITADLKHTRAEAMTANRPVAFVIEPHTHSYHIEGTKRRVPIPAGVAVSMELPAAQRGIEAGRLVFYPDGTSSGGRVTIAGTNGHAIVLDIAAFTGRIATEGPSK